MVRKRYPFALLNRPKYGKLIIVVLAGNIVIIEPKRSFAMNNDILLTSGYNFEGYSITEYLGVFFWRMRSGYKLFNFCGYKKLMIFGTLKKIFIVTI